MKSFSQIYDFLRLDLWRTSTKDISSATKRFFYDTLKTLILSIRGFSDNNISMRASSLTYDMMFAIVPILALIIGVARGFGFEEMIEDGLYKSFLGTTGMVPVIMGFVQRYLETAQGGVFIGAGIIFLLWSVYSFFQNIESSFNQIWQVKKSRSIMRQLTNYLAILLLVPTMIVISSGLSIMVNSTTSEWAFFQNMGNIKEFLIKLMPWVVTWLIFAALYWLVPNTKVSLHAALIPGFFIGTLVQALQSLSFYVIKFLARTSIVYGTFAALPLMLMWLQWTALLIYLGAQMSYSIQNREHFDYEQDAETMSRRYKDFLTIYLLRMIIYRFRDAQQPATAAELSEETHIPVRLVNQLLARLVETEVLHEIYIEHKEDKTFQPALDIHQISVGMVIDHIDQQGNELFLQHTPEPMDRFWKKWLTLRESPDRASRTLVMDL